METAMKTMLAKKNSEMEKLERSEKSELRMITSSAARIRLRYGKTDNRNKSLGETEARKIRMYETHNPGFCYLRNGEYRKKIYNNAAQPRLDPVQCCEKLKAILFTDDELDINKAICLHLLGTHVQSKHHIQRKDGRLCSYVKAQVTGNTVNTLQAVSQRDGTHVSDQPSEYDKMLPRYILDVALLNRKMSMSSVSRSSDYDSGSDDESRKKRKLLVPVYINNEVRIIINSILEALQNVGSYKLQALIDLASSPEALRNLLAREDMQEFMVDLAENPLIMTPTSYDYVTAHIMFDKIPEKGTMETVAQVLEVCDYFELKECLAKIRRFLFQRHIDLVNSNILPGRKSGGQDKISSMDNVKYFNSNMRFLTNPGSGSTELGNTNSLKGLAKKEKAKESKKSEKKSKNVILDKELMEENVINEDHSQSRPADSLKCDLRHMSNAQRILIGLKVASLKSRPLNMHQFEGKKKLDLASIINPIIRPQESIGNGKQHSHLLSSFSLDSEKKPKKSISRTYVVPMAELENLTRPLLANLRLEISETENKRRVSEFMERLK